ncbi:universal stress protein [Bradyrhizobium lablabi]|uniref:universal stress protein n=1 Tax=Bradyrhizobium lablabi TaxID=722472 RepID=UPI001BAE501F|nr:universal stress protein [Bradyrhizobium lablabi]MBR1125821.1 universal stress protein [Bradyrhizobium lablabi]
MAIKDILVALTSYPEPTQAISAANAVSVAAALGSHLAALSFETRVEVPGHVIFVSAVEGMIANETARSRDNARDLLAAFDAAAEKAGILHETILEKCILTRVPALLVEYARLRDLTILPLSSSNQWVADEVIFGSGRPTLILPDGPAKRPFALGTVVVAWDFSRAAARAVSDALPILELARQVRLVTVVNEKAIDSSRSGEELAKNLARHGINIVLDKEDAKGRQIGETLQTYAASHGADLLVMGAYGHSRLRDFVLGGATRSLLAQPTLPILLSH